MPCQPWLVDRISLDCWRIIHRIETQLNEMAKRSAIELTDLLELLNSMVIDLAAVDGLGVESMTRSQAFRFLDLGRRMERSVHTIALVRSALATATGDHGAMLESVLEVADRIMTYRARYLANLQMPAVLDLLLTDETNPPSSAYQLAMISDPVRSAASSAAAITS